MCERLLPRQRGQTTGRSSGAAAAATSTIAAAGGAGATAGAGGGAGAGAAAGGAGAPGAGAAGSGIAPSPDPHSAQKRDSAGFGVPQRGQCTSAARGAPRGEKSKSGAEGRDRAFCPSRGTPRGGVGSTRGNGACRRLPQSWQNLRVGGLSRPHRSHFTEANGTPPRRGRQVRCLRAGPGHQRGRGSRTSSTRDRATTWASPKPR